MALDCGSGVGRIAEQLLLRHFQEVPYFMPSSETCTCTFPVHVQGGRWSRRPVMWQWRCSGTERLVCLA